MELELNNLYDYVSTEVVVLNLDNIRNDFSRKQIFSFAVIIMVLNITKLGEDVLRQKATPVTEINDDIRKLAEDMFDTMIAANGVGLACPQVGLSMKRKGQPTKQTLPQTSSVLKMFRNQIHEHGQDKHT